ncbi:MAG: hypothetical protein Ta2G_16090 [Termitinemataceae bacterium]|nr:MAG: hypothetical protein Ta2G_16090 [Termitinemataceae bacterium]
MPLARACLEFAKLSAFPYGKEIIRDTELKGTDNVSGFSKVVTIILNILWFLIGLALTIIYFVLGILSFITIVGIPIGIVYVRMGKFVLFPIGCRVVTKKQAYASAAANEIEKRMKGKGNQNVVVNITPPLAETQSKPSAEKQIISLAQSENLLTLQQIIAKTNVEMDEAEEAIKKLIEKGIAKEVTDATGKKQFDFS